MTLNTTYHFAKDRLCHVVTVATVIVAFWGVELIQLQAQSGPTSSNAKSVTRTKAEREKAKRLEKARDKKFFATLTPAKIKAAQKGDTLVLPTQYHGVSEPLSELAKRPQPEISKENGPLFEDGHEELFEEKRIRSTGKLLPDPIQRTSAPLLTAVIGANFDAVVAAGSAPPDTTVAVGPNHIIVWVNSRYAIYNKTGSLLAGPVNGNTLFTGLGNVCESTNRGDPILQYDRLADRWILSQFAFNVTSGSASTPYFQCFAISTSNDPAGTYVRYSVSFSDVAPSGLPDYGKLGVFPDAYYTAYNMFQGTPAGSNSGAALCASDRTKMLAGDPTATTLCGPIAFYGGGGSFLPADLDGTTLPTNSTQGGIFIRQSTAPAINLIKLKPNFTAGTVTLDNGFGGAAGSVISVPIPTTLRACNGSGGTCIAQPGTTNQLDTLGSRLMYRAAYRNRGGTDSLVFAQTTDPDGAGTRGGAARWYEIRDPFALTPTMHQVGTFDGDGTGDRWMGSVAMNKDGDMLMGYSIVNSTTLKPSIALTGRRLADPLNTMQTETIAFTGSGSQTGTLTRWGDYTTMQVDPSDDQGFCFVGQYLPADGTFNWRSRVVCAKFAPLTAADVSIGGRVTSAEGRGVRGATVTLTDPSGGTRNVMTGARGQFRFDNVETGLSYVVGVRSRRFSFEPQVVTVNDNVTDLMFVAGGGTQKPGR